MEERVELENILNKLTNITKLREVLKELTPNEINRRRSIYLRSNQMDAERYDELVADGFDETDRELNELKKDIDNRQDLLKELEIVEEIEKQMPLHELKRKLDVYTRSRDINQERLEELVAEGFGEGDAEYDQVKKEIDKLNDLINLVAKIKDLLPDDYKIEIDNPEVERNPEEPEEPRDPEEPESPENPENPGGARDPREPRSPGGARDPRDPREPRSPGGARNLGEPRNPRRPGGARNPRDPRGPGRLGGPDEPIIETEPYRDPPNAKDKKDKKGKGNLPAKTFWEIVHETATEHAGTIPTIFNRYSKIKPFQLGLTLPFFPVKLGIKGISMLGDKICGAGRKKDIMQEKVDNLSQEEFDILQEGMTQAEMRQSKMNEMYLEAVYTRLERESKQKIENLVVQGEQLEEQENNMKQLYDQLNEELRSLRTTEERKQEIRAQLPAISTAIQTYSLARNVSRAQEEVEGKKIYDFRDGIDGKSNRRMNIKGWFAARFNPDNRDYIEEMATTSREMREARAGGDNLTATLKREELDQIKERNTQVTQILGDTRFANRLQINRGKATYEKHVVIPSQAAQTKGRQLMGLVTTAISAFTLGRAISQERDIDKAQAEIGAHNADIQKVNAHNTTLKNDVTTGKAFTPDKTTVEGVRSISAQNQASQIPVGHQQSLAENNGQYVSGGTNPLDMNIHATAHDMNQAVQTSNAAIDKAMSNGDYVTAFQEAVGQLKYTSKHLGDAIKDMSAGVSNYTQGSVGAQYEYALLTNATNSAKNSEVISQMLDQLVNLTRVNQQVGNITPMMTPQMSALDIQSMLIPAAATLAGTVGYIAPTAVKNNEQTVDYNLQNRETQIERDEQ